MPTYNPVVEIYKGVKIRRQNKIYLRVNHIEFKEIIDSAESTGLSMKKVLALSGTPCDRCKGIEVVYYDDSGNIHKIKRGILKMPHQSSGLTIIKHAKSCSISPEDL